MAIPRSPITNGKKKRKPDSAAKGTIVFGVVNSALSGFCVLVCFALFLYFNITMSKETRGLSQLDLRHKYNMEHLRETRLLILSVDTTIIILFLFVLSDCVLSALMVYGARKKKLCFIIPYYIHGVVKSVGGALISIALMCFSIIEPGICLLLASVVHVMVIVMIHKTCEEISQFNEGEKYNNRWLEYLVIEKKIDADVIPELRLVLPSK